MSAQRKALAARLCAVAPVCVVLAFLSVAGAAASTTGATSIQAKRDAILAYVHELQAQKKTLIGVQVNEYEVYIDCTSADRVFEQTGARPAIMGLELMNAIAVPPYAAYLTDRALTQTAAGGLVTMSWHERNPVEVCPRGEFFDCVKKPMTANTFRTVLTKGTPENKLWLADVDAVAKVLAGLRDRGIVVLFRPYHEMNGGWFWWGKQDAYPDLWDALYDRLAVYHKLDNLIWVWSPDRDAPDAARYFPRRHKPDIVGIDVYEDDPDSPKYAAGRANVTALGGSVPFVLAEVGIVPSSKVLDGINPAWVLLWGGEYLNADWAWDNKCSGCNTPDRVSALFKLDRTLTLAKMPASLRATIAAGAVNEHPLHRENPSCPAKLH
jgi:mannan endo-1,4-beta-mannosidase